MFKTVKLFDILKLLRPHQYIKNTFIYAPLFFIGSILNWSLFLDASIAFVAFSLSASGIYILNDYLDIEEDKHHPRKKYRPLAAGKVGIKLALLLMFLIIIAGLLLMLSLSMNAFLVLIFYIVLNVAYCFHLKQIAILDVTIISLGFVLRLFVGSIATDVPLSLWVVLMTFLLALFLALAKRRDDVIHYNDTGVKMRKVIDGYNLPFVDAAMAIMASVVIVTYILYTTSVETIERLNSEYLYLTSLFVIVGILRYLQITFVENNSGSPTKIALTDKFVQLTVAAWIFSFTYILYL